MKLNINFNPFKKKEARQKNAAITFFQILYFIIQLLHIQNQKLCCYLPFTDV